MQHLAENMRGCRVKQVAVRHWLIQKQGLACTLTGERPEQQDLASYEDNPEASCSTTSCLLEDRQGFQVDGRLATT